MPQLLCATLCILVRHRFPLKTKEPKMADSTAWPVAPRARSPVESVDWKEFRNQNKYLSLYICANLYISVCVCVCVDMHLV